MKKVFLLRFLVVLLVPFVTLSCDSVTTPKVGMNIVATVIQQTGGSAIFRIGVENTGTKTEPLNFSSSQFFDIVVKDSRGHLLWQYSYGSYFLEMLWGLELAPGESSQVREYVWDLTGNDQKPLPSGSYKATMYITNSPRDEGLSKVVTLTI